METAKDNLNYQLLVNSIKNTFKGSGKIVEVLSSLNALFSQFDGSLDIEDLRLSPERKYEREMLLGVVTVLLDHIIKDQNSTIQTETVSRFLNILKLGMNQSSAALNVMKQLNSSKSLLEQVNIMFESEGVSDDDIEDVAYRIRQFLNSSSENDHAFNFHGRNEDLDELENKLFDGWSKNEREMKKRGKKLDHFRNESAEQLQVLEKSIDESKRKNEQFRSTLDETSNKISTLIQKLNDANKQCEFMQNQIDIVDSTITEMEKCKQKTDEEYAQLEEKLMEKENSLVQFLKTFDCSMDESLSRHQEMLERNDSFNEALEELAQCYDDFQQQEDVIVRKHNLAKIQHFAKEQSSTEVTQLNGMVNFLQREHQDDISKMKSLEDRNLMLTADVDDLFEMNNKLTNENIYLHGELERMSLNGPTIECKTTDTQQLQTLKAENQELHAKVRQLTDIQSAVQVTYKENNELLDENDHLQEEIETLEDNIKTLKEENLFKTTENEKFKLENKSLKQDFENIHEVYQPRVLRMATNLADIVTLLDQRNTELTLEELLQNEHARVVSLDKSRAFYLNSCATLTDIYRRIGLDNVEASTTYNITFQNCSNDSTHIFRGFSVTEKELQSINIKANSLDSAQVGISQAEDKIVDELSNMLKDSYASCDVFKQTQKKLREEIVSLQYQLQSQNQTHDTNRTNDSTNGITTSERNSSLLQSFITLYEEMGIGQLEHGVTYSIHYQAMRTGRRASKPFQHTVAAINFDIIKSNMNQIIKKEMIVSPRPLRRQIIHAPNFNSSSPLKEDRLLESCTKDEDVIVNFVNTKIGSSLNKSTKELERLLRIAKRENKEVMDKNRSLRRELNHLKENKERFKDSQKKIEDDDESSGKEEEKVEQNKMMDQELDDLKQAYRLTEANCTFLEQQNAQLSNRITYSESLAYQYSNDIFDTQENMECVSQELSQQRKKNDNKEREITELKKDIEYLENDLEYCREKLQEAGVHHQVKQSNSIFPEKVQSETSLRADLDMIIAEKNSLILECESLVARIKFLDAEKKFAVEEARVLSEQNKRFKEEYVVNTVCRECQSICNRQHENDVSDMIEKEVRTNGLAKQFKSLQKELKEARKELQEKVTEQLRASQSANMLTIEFEALQSTNKELEDKIISLEQHVIDDDIIQDKSILSIHEAMGVSEAQTKNLQEDAFNDSDFTIEGKRFLFQENEEIKESNKFLLQRNSRLRRESLTASLTQNQVKLLQEKVCDLENENVILKLESMKSPCRGRKKSMASRRLSQQCDEIMDIQSWQINKLNTKTTQTDSIPAVELTEVYNFGNIDAEEMQFVIEDLTKRNTEIKIKLHQYEEEVNDLSKEIKRLEDQNENLLKRSREFKEKTEKHEDEETKEHDAGQSQLYNPDDYVKLDEQHKTLRYENRMLKQDVTDYQSKIQEKEITEEELKKQILKLEDQLNQTLFKCTANPDNKTNAPVTSKDEINNLKMENDLLNKTIEKLENQLQQQNESHGGSNLVTKDDSAGTANGTVDELFEVKFLLESNTQYFDEDTNSIKSNSSMTIKSEDEELFQSCIQEGELVSEMEEFFRKFSESSSLSIAEAESAVIKEEIVDDETTSEPLARGLKQQSNKVINEYKKKNHILQVKCFELQKIEEKLRAEIKSLDKQLETSEERVLGYKISLSDRSEEMSHHLQRIMDLESLEESLCIEIENLDSSFKEKNAELNDAIALMNEQRYKFDTLKKECNGYKSMVEDQEKLLATSHEQSTVMQRNFNNLFKDNNECKNTIETLSNKMKELKDELEIKNQELKQEDKQKNDLTEEYNALKVDFDKINTKNVFLENAVQEYEQQFLQLEDGLDFKLKQDNEVNKKFQTLQECNLEKEKVIMELKEQLRDCEDVISAYEQRTHKETVTDELVGRSQNDISFEIRQVSSESRNATEVSIDNGDVTLPEIKIMKMWNDQSTTAPSLCGKCFQRSVSEPITPFNSNNLLPNKYLKHHSVSGVLSEVSDVDSLNADSDSEKSYSSDYVAKLKNKLKVSRNKLRDRNKVIQNQNEDIDNFLEDIRNREIHIFQLKRQIQEMENECKHQVPSGEETKLLSLDTPEFLDTVSSYMDKDEMICSLIALNEECCIEIKSLQNAIEELHAKEQQISSGDYESMQSKLQTSQENINKLTEKMSKYLESELINKAESFEKESALVFFDEPNKTVNDELRNDNEQLIAQNVDLRVEVEELKEKLNKNHPQMNSSSTSERDIYTYVGQEMMTNVCSPNNELRTVDNETLGDMTTLSHTETQLSKSDEGRETVQSQGTSYGMISDNDCSGNVEDKIKELGTKLATAERQIEKDWIIIEEQSRQLENLHVLFIEQRDQNKQRMNTLVEKDKEFELLNKKIIEIQATSKGKEQELGRMLEEKETGIEKLHSMIFEPEKSLNSRTYIEGMLKESMTTRENEESKDRLIKEYESHMATLKEEITHLKGEKSTISVPLQILYKTEVLADHSTLAGIQQNVTNIKCTQSTLKEEFLRLKEDYKTEMIVIFNQLQNLLAQNSSIVSVGGKSPKTDALSASSDNEELFVPKQRKRNKSFHDSSSFDSDEVLTWKMKYQQKEKQYERLHKCLEEKEKCLLRKDNIHMLEIDTLVQSLTKKHLNYRHRLTPSANLSKAANRTGQKEFLQQCLLQLKTKRIKEEIQSAPEP